MAPKKTNTDPKGKATTQAGTSAAVARGAALEGVMPQTRVTAAAIARVKEQTMSQMSPRGGGVNRRLTLFLFRGLIIAE